MLVLATGGELTTLDCQRENTYWIFGGPVIESISVTNQRERQKYVSVFINAQKSRSFVINLLDD